ncbi:precorrin-6A synthase (deacetylating) [Rhodococcus sp. 14-2470-1a]|uniref:precorrin-6A synthase (deacetylating) n=1 Tax=Rhodococcus sp. 14-2470-1a TaxID=2023150 RepID=UPI000B9C4C74|nr:precorrin-6A synthase (deacetylating) [Rhodococcus sp. 14-2470-1a]OZF49125.1 precorrin-6A synthase (deacetylating) [Rhodococcus sp. 14-2470-1a]
MKVHLVGVGGGHPDQVTVQAIEKLQQVDVFLVADKGDGVGDLAEARTEILRRHVTGDYRVVQVPDPARDRKPSDYGTAVTDWHEARARAYREVLDGLPSDTVVGFLVWGDPSLYDSTIRVAEQLGVEFDVTPGVSSVSMLAASHRIVLNRIGGPIVITTGRALQKDVAAGADNLVVMLDGGLACRELVGSRPWDIYWGANLGTEDEKLVAGDLDDVIDEIASIRAELKARHGWVMDIYVLRARR